jgi:hypothetical protein
MFLTVGLAVKEEKLIKTSNRSSRHSNTMLRKAKEMRDRLLEHFGKQKMLECIAALYAHRDYLCSITSS